MKLSVGVDEAGRGCVIGPLVVACVAANEKDRRWFAAQNVRDSKLIPGKERDELAKKIKARCWFEIRIATPMHIDRAVRDRTRTLNGLEMELMAELLQTFQTQHADHTARAWIDACSINAKKFEQDLFQRCTWNMRNMFRATHHADARDRTVAAASIVAKTERERLIAELKKEVGIDFGCGYSHDEVTRNFLKTCHTSAQYVRWSWKTARIANSAQ